MNIYLMTRNYTSNISIHVLILYRTYKYNCPLIGELGASSEKCNPELFGSIRIVSMTLA
jgi:hypothetical protein